LSGNFGHDRHFFLCEAIQQTRLSDVWLADQYNFGTVAQNPALLRYRQQCFHTLSQATQFFQDAPALEKIDVFFGKIQGRFNEGSQFDERTVKLANATRKFTRQRAHRASRSCFRTGVDQIGNALRLGKIELVIQECALSKFTRLRSTRAQIKTPSQDQPEDCESAMALQLEHVFTGIGMRGGVKNRNPSIQNSGFRFEKVT